MKSKTKKAINNPMFICYKSRRSKRFIVNAKPFTEKSNRKERKRRAREIKKDFCLDKIPCASYESIMRFYKQAHYEWEYEKYANW